MQLINVALVLAASLASTVQARHAVKAHLHPRSYDNSTYPATSTVVLSPLPVISVPMGTGVSSVIDDLTTKVSNATLTYTMSTGSSTTVITTTIKRTETQTRTIVSKTPHDAFAINADTSVQTVYAVSEDSTAVETGVADLDEVVTSTNADTGVESTTTITDRSTTTKTVTVQSVDPSSDGALGAEQTDSGDDGNGSSETGIAGGNGAASPTGCAPVATVTETIKSTVTVVSSDDSKAYSSSLLTSPVQTASPRTAVNAEASSTKDTDSTLSSIEEEDVYSPSSLADIGSTSSSTENAGPVPSSSDSLPIPIGSTSPYNNDTATHPKKPKKKCASSGFMTMPKPTTSTAVSPIPTEDTGYGYRRH